MRKWIIMRVEYNEQTNILLTEWQTSSWKRSEEEFNWDEFVEILSDLIHHAQSSSLKLCLFIELTNFKFIIKNIGSIYL